MYQILVLINLEFLSPNQNQNRTEILLFANCYIFVTNCTFMKKYMIQGKERQYFNN